MPISTTVREPVRSSVRPANGEPMAMTKTTGNNMKLAVDSRYGEGGDEQRRHEDYSRLGQAGQRREEVDQRHLPLAEQAEMQNGIFGAAFDDNEDGNEDNGQEKAPNLDRSDAGAEIGGVELVDAIGERRQQHGEHGHTGPVEGAALLRSGRRQQAHGCNDQCGGNGQVDQEEPMPA